MNALLNSLVAADLVGEKLTNQLHARAQDAVGKKDLYLGEMAKATAQDDIFKNFMLANMASMDSYVVTARLQSQSSFALCRKVAYLSFLLIFLGVGFGFWAAFTPDKNFDMAKLTGLTGILTQLISGVFFYFYNKTIEQVNRFSDKLSGMQELAICFVANSNIQDSAKRDDSTAALARQLLNHQTVADATANPTTTKP
jgi:hypothetical protein